MDYKFFASYQTEGTNVTSLNLHTHKQFEIYYFHEGDCWYQVNDKFFNLTPGDILLIDGNKPHRVFLNQDNPIYIRSVIHFDPDFLMEYLSKNQQADLLDLFNLDGNRQFIVNSSNLNRNIDWLVQRLSDLSSQSFNPEVSFLTSSYITALLLELKHLYQRDSNRALIDKQQKMDISNRVINYITQHYNEDISLNDISSGINISKSYMSQEFKKESGESVMEFLMSYRFGQAQSLILLEPEKPIMDIALQTGFKSNAHFSRYFKQKTGLTPSHYRKKYRTK